MQENQEQKKRPGCFMAFFRGINILRLIIINIIFFFFFFSFLGVMGSIPSNTKTVERVPNEAVLMINPSGILTEKEADIFSAGIPAIGKKSAVVVSDLVKAIKNAASDRRITSLYLDFSELRGLSSGHLSELGNALRLFKNSGKKIYAYAVGYSIPSYFLASYADRIGIDPLGEVSFAGFASRPVFFKGLEEKFGIKWNVIQAGTYKGMAETYSRDNLSQNISAMIAINSLANTLFSSLTNIATRGMNIKTVFPILKKFENIEINSEAKNLLQPSFKNKIKITNLNFAYTPEKPILKNVNMEFEIGKKYGIIGESGSGKTTFFKLLNGMLEDYEGKIEYDGISLLNLDKEKIRENVAYIDQNVYIFNDTIKENICLGKNYPDEKIDNSIKESALLPMIQNLENGINTPASENGKNFSGGQRQRIAIARALIHGRKILLIDEGTSSLDKENALEIEKRLIENPDLTVIMISHNFDPQIKEKLDGVYKL